jgi:hypothetical protein
MAPTRKLSELELRKQLRSAKQRSAILRLAEPRAQAARYDALSGALHIELTNKGVVEIPVALIPELKGIDATSLSKVKVDPLGKGLLWRDLDIGLDFVAVLERMLGKFIGSSAARQLGRRTSQAKAAAARANGQKGGRPRKTESARPKRRSARKTSEQS